MALRAKQPEIKPSNRAKILVSGEAGAGKSFFALQFPNCYFIDSEGGAEREQYQKLLIESGGAYMGREDGASDFDEVIKEVKSLATEKHSYKTLVIDSFSHLYMLAASEAEEKFGSDYGKDKKMANIPSRQLLRWVDKIDMNVVLICHSKTDWSQVDKTGKTGTTFDAFDKTSYFLDLWLEIKGKNFVVRKTRIESLKDGHVFPREYSNFADLFGRSVIDKETEALVLASEEDVKKAKQLSEVMNLNEDQISKFYKKVDVDSWEEMTSDQINSVIKFMENKIKGVK